LSHSVCSWWRVDSLKELILASYSRIVKSVLHRDGIMKIITIRQPWAHLIVNGRKNIENRSWRTSYRGPVLIHASLNIDREDCLKHGLDPKTVQTGGVVGIAEITDCVQQYPSSWFRGPYGFVLRNRRSLPFIKWTGALSSRCPNSTSQTHCPPCSSRIREGQIGGTSPSAHLTDRRER
jgi:hypothetical protein